MSAWKLPPVVRSLTARTRAAALVLLLTGAAAWVWAHAGHQALPTAGVSVDPEKGLLRLGRRPLRALGVETAVVGLQGLEERLAAPATVVAPWQQHAFATPRLGGKVVRIHAVPGQTVTRGQVVAEVESLELENL